MPLGELEAVAAEAGECTSDAVQVGTGYSKCEPSLSSSVTSSKITPLKYRSDSVKKE